MNKNLLYIFAKKIKIGIVLYYIYYYPRSYFRKILKRGIFENLQDLQAKNEMKISTSSLRPIQIDRSQSSFNIHFLTGKNFWYQTCFCAYSMSQNSDVTLCPVIYDDGSLEQKNKYEIQRIFANAEFVSKNEIEDRINTYLPENKFPFLRERRLNYPNIRKLTDIHVGSSGWKLVLDSDMVFFRNPIFLIDWLKKPKQPCHMVDVETAYGYPLELMQSLSKAKIPNKLNVGICGLKSDDIDWVEIEYWCRTMIEQQGTHYYQEQALVAMLMARHTCSVAPEKDYLVMPSLDETLLPTATLHHYVSDSKPWYFRYGWKHVMC